MSAYGYVWTAPAWRRPLLGGKQTFDLNVRFSADYVRFSSRSGRIDTVTVESARDPKPTSVLRHVSMPLTTLATGGREFYSLAPRWPR